ncbi:hypothetical protein [Paenibacillus shenyangensis]|uniref:hypothetical protein n=1 Tax=Paenibacillus sp. A9 TaxID=1284352 RepID=UPI00037BA7FF|nr:hypothetical protein [Paenibacillus sp. A9]
MQHSLEQTLPARYLIRLTDDTGIFQHTKFGIPDRSKGYTTDDNARALIAAVMLYTDQQSEETARLMRTYLAFVYHAQNEDGTFRNFMDYNRVFNETVGSDDCQGRCVWALGWTIAQPEIPNDLRNTCRYMINQAIPQLAKLRSPRAIAYALVGLTTMLESTESLHYVFPSADQGEYDAGFLPRAEVEQLIETMSTGLYDQYQVYRGEDWHWYENSMTYGNAMLPWAMYKASQFLRTRDFAHIAEESLDFLVRMTIPNRDYFKPIGSHGWLERGDDPAPYDEQPIEASEMLMACMEAYQITGRQLYYDYALLCYEWFHGRNSIQTSLIDKQTGGCYDGIHVWGLNLNQGSENVVSYCMAHTIMHGR